MSDILASISILIAILTAIFSIFYSDIRDIIDAVPQTLPANDGEIHIKGKKVRNCKLFPLLFGCIIVTAVFIPEFFLEINNALNVYIKNNHHFDWNRYDTVSAAYIATTLFAISLTLAVIVLTWQFLKNLIKLNPRRKS